MNKITGEIEDLIAELQNIIELVEDSGEEGLDCAIEELSQQTGTIQTILELMEEGY